MVRAMHAPWFVVPVLAICGAAPALADPLTCTAFRERLDAALLASQQNADAITFKPGFSSPERGTRYDFASGSLTGALRCTPADQFEEYEIDLQFQTGSTLASDLKQLMTAQGAGICALTAATAPACTEFGRTMLEAALSQMGAAFNHGVLHPSGLSESTLFGTLHLTLTSAPTLITFIVGPGLGHTFDATRQPLPAPPAAVAPG